MRGAWGRDYMTSSSRNARLCPTFSFTVHRTVHRSTAALRLELTETITHPETSPTQTSLTQLSISNRKAAPLLAAELEWSLRGACVELASASRPLVA